MVHTNNYGFILQKYELYLMFILATFYSLLFKRKLIATSDTFLLLLSMNLISIQIKCMVNTRSINSNKSRMFHAILRINHT